MTRQIKQRAINIERRSKQNKQANRQHNESEQTQTEQH